MTPAVRQRSCAALLLGTLAGIAGAAPSDTPLDFELGGEDGFVRLSAQPPQVSVVNFWRSDCPPCVREMPLLEQTARHHPQIRVVAVAVQQRSETAAGPLHPTPPVLLLHAPSTPRGLLSRFGNPSGALPHTVVLDRERRPCARRTGELDEAWLEAALRRCDR
ncbi:TlpA family protein disulfide reductase [Azospira sp. I09]|uniref:TlpA family protein disulfide reductase n=1 Tax=Azospira sp. I09 TaxID=1765049 RepID=UPI00129F837E|nr:TlpA disulfide reductase family protein [Azospira sp. I09]BBN90277.1 thioredoxin [Azospira sp. I09]